MIKGSRLRDRADGNLPKLVGGVEAEGDAVDLGHGLARGGAVAVGDASRCCSQGRLNCAARRGGEVLAVQALRC